MEFIDREDVHELSNPGVRSRQLICPNNSSSMRVTITEVHLMPGATQPRHRHESSEQIWYALRGEGQLLLSGNTTRNFAAGDVVRFADGDVHGLINSSDEEFVYVAVTSPPLDFGYAYESHQS